MCANSAVALAQRERQSTYYGESRDHLLQWHVKTWKVKSSENWILFQQEQAENFPSPCVLEEFMVTLPSKWCYTGTPATTKSLQQALRSEPAKSGRHGAINQVELWLQHKQVYGKSGIRLSRVWKLSKAWKMNWTQARASSSQAGWGCLMFRWLCPSHIRRYMLCNQK